MKGTKARLGAVLVGAVMVVAGLASAQSAGATTVPPLPKNTAVNTTGHADETKQPAGSKVTTHADGSYDVLGPAPAGKTNAALSFRDSLHVGTPVWTGVYKKIISGPHVTYVKVYLRTVHGCKGQALALIQNCQSNVIAYASGFAACYSGCTVGGRRGSQDCQAEGSDTNGLTSDLAACNNHLTVNGYSSTANETDKDCVPVGGCSEYAWHINVYPTGNATGPYNGTGPL